MIVRIYFGREALRAVKDDVGDVRNVCSNRATGPFIYDETGGGKSWGSFVST